VRERSAVVLEPEKAYLAETRLAPLALREGHGSIRRLVARLRQGPANGLHRKVVEAMTTNESYFFRDVRPFEAFRQVVVPDILKHWHNERGLTVWCGACSSGQEPYSVAMLLEEHFPQLVQRKLRIIASDLSTTMLDKARQGKYSQMEVNRGLPARLLVKYFVKQDTQWEILPSLRRLVEFRELNLIGPWSHLPPLDVIFLRNVLIYFDTPTKKAILAKIHQLLARGGYLFLGGAETTLNLDNAFERVDFDRGCCFRFV
jgi:chemotaxis protein methyltransferase CheR